MKIRLFLAPFAFLAVLAFRSVSASSQTVVTFDDLHEAASGSFISDGYQGLVWGNFACANGILNPNNYPFLTNGAYYGVVSPSNIVYNASGTPAEIDSPGTNFNFLSAYFTGAWNSNLNIEVEGFRDTNLIYDQTLVVSATTPTLFAFNYLDIDRLYFDSYGGEPAFDSVGASHFVMDNFMFEFVPEPSTFLLAALGAVSLAAFLRRKRT